MKYERSTTWWKKIKSNRLKILLSSSRLVEFSFTSFLNKGTVQRLSIVTGKTLFQRSGAWDEIADLEKHFGYWCAMLWNLEVNILGLEWFMNIETKVLNILFVEKINNFNSWNILVIISNLPFLNINLKASFFSDWTTF